MRFVSTRGAAPPVGFDEVLLSGLAPDGGLYVPSHTPHLNADDLASMRGASFAETCARLLAPFAAPAVSEAALRAHAQAAYAAFSHPQVAPLAPLEPGLSLLELFHGPTLAFKDVAMQMLARLFEDRLAVAGRRKTIIGATSGDTGGAAVEAFAGVSSIDLVMLHPKGRISDVQRRIMTTVDAPNIVNVAVEGTFDDCQRIVKALFMDEVLNARRDLAGVNSINWVRLAIQMTYYFTAAAALGARDRPPVFVVPTGNFGDAYAGHLARALGLPMGKIIVATNENDILHRAILHGDYSTAQVRQTSSPSMDIQVASNFERLLYEANGEDAASLSAMMTSFGKTGAMRLGRGLLDRIQRDFLSYAAGEAEVAAEMRAEHRRSGRLVDPHTAVGLAAARRLRERGAIQGEAIVLATAHAAKFPDAVEAATGERPRLPAHLSDLHAKPERFIDAPADVSALRKIVMSAGAP